MATRLTQTTIGLLSSGSMGSAVGRSLAAHGFRVITNVSDRSPTTRERAREAGFGLVATDIELFTSVDYFLSVVPPRDALSTAERAVTALQTRPAPSDPRTPLYYLDLNAISPQTMQEVVSRLTQQGMQRPIRLIDGAIIGRPARKAATGGWFKPRIPLSGPWTLPKKELAVALNSTHLGNEIGSASALKLCFASLLKGSTALGVLAFTTARRLGVLDELKEHLHHHSPGFAHEIVDGVASVPPKAYRWVREMEEIAAMMTSEGGFQRKENSFWSTAELYRLLTSDAVLRNECTTDSNCA